MVLSELGETCEDRGWIPIGSLDECIASTGFFKTYYPGYEFQNTENEDLFPKGCYVWKSDELSWGYFNTHQSGAGNSRSKALCTIPKGKKLKKYIKNPSYRIFG